MQQGFNYKSVSRLALKHWLCPRIRSLPLKQKFMWHVYMLNQSKKNIVKNDICTGWSIKIGPKKSWITHVFTNGF